MIKEQQLSPSLSHWHTHTLKHSASKQKTTSTISRRTGLINWGGGPLACLFLCLCVRLETHNSLCYLVKTFLSPLRNPPVAVCVVWGLVIRLWEMSSMAFCGNVAHEIRFHACMVCWYTVQFSILCRIVINICCCILCNSFLFSMDACLHGVI